MLTVEDVAAIPLFSTLPRREQERLARTSADLRLSPGEFAVPEGGERALFAVLSGKIEVIKTIDGVERTLGWRVPGTIFGEVPIALGTPFPGGYRAAEPSRVMRVDIQEYYATAAVSKDISLKVSALARERIGGLQSIADEPRKPRVILVGQRWDTECANLRRFLARNQISFNWLTPEAPELATLWPGPRPQDSDGPALLTDGQVMVRPQVRDLANRLGLQTSPRSDEYDVAIIGGGPAGLAAAVYGASEGLRTIIVEREAPGGQAGTSSRIENYLGFPSGGFRRRACQSRTAASETAWSRNPRHPFRQSCRSNNARSLPGWGRGPAGKNPHSRNRRQLAPARNRRPRSADRQRRLLWGCAQRSERHAWARHSPRRCGKLSRPGGTAFRQSRPQGDARCPRRQLGKEYVALSHRAAPQ